VRKVADEYDITPYIQFSSKVTAMDFSSNEDIWSLTITDTKTKKTRRIKSRFVTAAAGYYKFDEGYTPHFEGREAFKGEIIHPQHWPEDFNYAGKNIIVIGSGATAVTLMPELAKTAGHVTTATDHIGNFFRAILPAQTAYKINRAKNIWITRRMYKKARENPEKTREWFRKKALKSLGQHYPVDVHFNPDYNPWDQRVCMIPDEDMFIAIREGRASVVTDQIDRFTETGIRLKSGEALTADVIVTATGLNVVFNGEAQMSIDGTDTLPSDSYSYKGMMYSGIPNLVSVFGYTNASWTLRADLISEFVIRLISHMKEKGYSRAVPVPPADMPRSPWIDFQAGYLLRVMDQLPSQGDRHPWLNKQDYKTDQKLMLEDPIEDGALIFSKPYPQQMAAE